VTELVSQADRRRGRMRLAALGLAPADGPSDESAREAALRAFYEQERARFIQLASHGLHLAPGQALYGMVVQAIKDANGWDRLPADWPSEHPDWPTT
jgi:hypothetical protein